MSVGHFVAAPRWASLLGTRTILSGFIASMAMVLSFPVAYGLALFLSQQRLPGPLPAWLHGLTHNAFLDAALPNPYAALGIFFAGGLVWAMVYNGLVSRRLAGPDWRRGVTFSLIPWLFSLAVFFPLVGAGFFGLGLGAGPLPILGNLVLHLLYGGVLGAISGPLGDRVDGESSGQPGENAASLRLAEDGAVKGLVGGLVVGLVVGAVVATPLGRDGLLAGLNPIAAIVGSALVAGSFGVVVGSLTGLARGTED